MSASRDTAPHGNRLHNEEPLRRVYECVFGALALESEPVDPRL
jgi:protein phosphatase